MKRFISVTKHPIGKMDVGSCGIYTLLDDSAWIQHTHLVSKDADYTHDPLVDSGHEDVRLVTRKIRMKPE